MGNVEDVFGKITPPVRGLGGSNPGQDISTLIAGLINTFLVAIGILALVYMMWGAISWVTSSGDKDRLQKAQARIRSALIGIFIAIVVLVLFNAVFSIAFPNSGIITPSNRGFNFSIQSFNSSPSKNVEPRFGPR